MPWQDSSETVDLNPRERAPITWLYSMSIDEHMPKEQRARYISLIETFAKTTQEREHGGYAMLAQLDPKRFFELYNRSRNVVTEADLRAQLLLDASPDARNEALRAVLASAPSFQNWSQLVMLLSTWPADQDPAGALRTAERHLASWPDEHRGTVGPWLDRAREKGDGALHALSRAAYSQKLGEDLAAGVLAHATVLETRDLAGLREHHPRLGHVTELLVRGEKTSDRLIPELTGMTGLKKLFLQYPYWDGGGRPIELGPLLAAQNLAGLTHLALEGYTVSAAELKALAQGPQPLEHVRFENARIKSAAGGKALAELASKKPLRSLELKYNELGPKGAAALVAGKTGLESLRALDISANEIGDAGFAALVGCERLRELRWLNVSSNDAKGQIGKEGALALANARALGKLETVIASGHPFDSEALAAIFESPHLRSLRAFACFCAAGTWAALFERCGQGEPVPLERLDLGSMRSSKERADWSRGTFLRGVTALKADALDGREYAGLFECPHLARLTTLNLGGCYENAEAGLDALCNAAPPPALKYLSLKGWKLTAKQAEKVARAKIAQSLAGLELMASYMDAKVAAAFLEAGVPLVTGYSYEEYPVNEQRHWSVHFRDDV